MFSMSQRSLRGFRVLTVFVVASASPLCAADKVWVVDAALGSGAHFATLQQAVDAAADLDTVLVRTGTYAPFLLMFKSLAVVADSGAAVTVLGGPKISSTTSGQWPVETAIVLHGLDFLGAGGLDSQGWVAVGQNGVQVWIAQCTTRNTWLETSSSTLVLNGCSFEGSAALSAAFPATPGLLASGRVLASSTRFRGGAGANANAQQAALPGAPGAVVWLNGAFWATDVVVRGGDGGAGAVDGSGACIAGADGGAGLHLEDGWYLDYGTQALGGAGGAAGSAACAGTGGSTGSALNLAPVPWGIYEQHSLAAPLLDGPGVVREGQAGQFTWTGPAGLAVIVYGPKVGSASGWTLPVLHVDSTHLVVGAPWSLQIVGVPSAPASLQLPFQVGDLGAGIESARLYAQALHVDLATLEVACGGARALVLLDASL
jgi:hypothetical protein